MINFAVKEGPKTDPLAGVKKITLGLTTAILVLYIVAVSGMLGWKWYLEGKEEVQQGDIRGLTEQILAKTSTEILIRKIDARSKVTKDFINSRVDTRQAAANLVNEQIKVKEWVYSGVNEQTADLGASSPATLSDFISVLGEKYTAMQINKSVWAPEKGWISSIALKGAGK